MKLVLTEALHARPADLLVRVASQLAAEIELRKGERRANAKSILEVLSLHAAAGDTIELDARGEDSAKALETLRQLVERRFDPDLAPETGTAAAAGIAIGSAVVIAVAFAGGTKGTPAEEQARLRDATLAAERDLDALVRSLPAAEAALFAPERKILEELLPRAVARAAVGASAEEAVTEESRDSASDLLIDARARLLDALAGGGSTLSRALSARPEPELVLVAESLSPSIVASLPARVKGIVASLESPGAGPASHAAILARGKGIPLVYVEDHVVAAIADGEIVVVDTTDGTARVWVAPGKALVEDRRAAQEALAAHVASSRAASLEHLGVDVRVNVSSIHDDVPLEATGIGLVRTELVFAARSLEPSAREQAATFGAIASKARGAPVVVRLFDAGGDKPLAWMPAPADAPEARGMELLVAHPRILSEQLDALASARAHGDLRVLLPMTRSARDVELVRERCGAGALPVGAMIETKEAVASAAAIAAAADFVCIGTNDLAASVHGVNRARETSSAGARDPELLAAIRDVVRAAHSCGRLVTVCGELAGDDQGAPILVGLGVDALSVAPARLADVRLALAKVTRQECEARASSALVPSPGAA